MHFASFVVLSVVTHSVLAIPVLSEGLDARALTIRQSPEPLEVRTSGEYQNDSQHNDTV